MKRLKKQLIKRPELRVISYVKLRPIWRKLLVENNIKFEEGEKDGALVEKDLFEKYIHRSGWGIDYYE